MRNPLSQLTDAPKEATNKFNESPFSVEYQEAMQELVRQLQAPQGAAASGGDKADHNSRANTAPDTIDFSDDIYNSDGR